LPLPESNPVANGYGGYDINSTPGTGVGLLLLEPASENSEVTRKLDAAPQHFRSLLITLNLVKTMRYRIAIPCCTSTTPSNQKPHDKDRRSSRNPCHANVCRPAKGALPHPLKS
jgi:hypothetical protein